MDPVTALGLVSAIVTVIDASYKAAKICKEIKENGVSGVDSDRERASKVLQTETTALAAAVRQGRSSVTLSQEDKDLLALCDESCKIAQTLQDEVERIRKHNSSLRKFSLSILSSRANAKLERRLDRNSKLVDSIVIKRLGSDADRARASSAQLDARTQQLVTAVSQGFLTLEQLRPKLADHIEQASEAIIHHQEEQSRQTHELIVKVDATQRATEARQSRVKAVLDSLSFPEMFLREEAVADRNTTTCRFLFQETIYNHETREHEERPSKFLRWLKSNESLFWITGKAGAGKSVIIKYACFHDTTLQNLQLWADQRANSAGTNGTNKPRNLLTLRHFFWKPGCRLQHSLNGLVRSLLWQLIQHSRDMDNLRSNFDSLLPAEANIRTRQWTIVQLRQIFDRMISELAKDAFICVFIDALDECVDDSGDVMDLLRFLSELPSVKVCVSSRPAEFSVELRSVVSVRLQDVNMLAILDSARDRLLPLLHEYHAEEEDDRKDQVCWEIAQKSEGIFLWAELVIKQIATDAKVGQDIDSILRSIRNDIPGNIADLFQHMIDKIEPRYMEEMRHYFGMLTIYQENWWCSTNLLNMVFFNKEVWRHFWVRDWDYFTTKDFRSKCQALQSRIEICAGGLIEISAGYRWPTALRRRLAGAPVKDADQHPILQFCREVKYVHRSVQELLFVGDGRDFSGSSGGTWKQRSLRECIRGIHGFIGLLPGLPCIDLVLDSRYALFQWLCDLLRRLEDVNDPELGVDVVSQSYSICELVWRRLAFAQPSPSASVPSFSKWWFFLPRWNEGCSQVFDIPSFASSFWLHLYISAWVTELRPSASQLTEALWLAVSRFAAEDFFTSTRPPVEWDFYRTISILLQAGADPNQPFRIIQMPMGYRPMLKFKSDAAMSSWQLARSSGLDALGYQWLVPLVRVFVDNGAQINSTAIQLYSERSDGLARFDFVIVISPLTYVRGTEASLSRLPKRLKRNLERRTNYLPEAEFNSQALIKLLESRNAVDYFRVHAVNVATPKNSSGDECVDSTDEGPPSKSSSIVTTVEGNEVEPETSDPHSITPERRVSSVSGTVYTERLCLFSEEDSQKFQDLLFDVVPGLPTDFDIEAVSRAIQNDPRLKEFLNSTLQGLTDTPISIPLWCKAL